MDFPTKEQAMTARSHFKYSLFMWLHSDNDGDSEPYK